MHSKLKLYALSLGISCLGIAAAQAQTIIYQEDWSSYTVGESVVGEDWYNVRTPPAGSPAVNNTTIVYQGPNGKYLSLLAHPTVGTTYAPLIRNASTNPDTPIQLHATLPTRVSVDIRFESPNPPEGVNLNRGTSQPYSTFRFIGDGGNIWFGYVRDDRIFSGAGGNYHQFDLVTTDWYRFAMDMNPLDGSLLLRVFEVDGVGNTGAEIIALTPRDADGNVISGVFTEITQLNFEILRPGNTQAAIDAGQVWSGDFANLTISTVPEPATVAALLSGSALALALGVRTWRRRR